jgi:hypothetical protein
MFSSSQVHLRLHSGKVPLVAVSPWVMIALRNSSIADRADMNLDAAVLR